MTDCSLFVTKEEYQQHLFDFQLLKEKVEKLFNKIEGMTLRIDAIEQNLNSHVEQFLCQDNVHGGLQEIDIKFDLEGNQLTVYLNICDQTFKNSILLEDVFVGVEIKIDQLQINQELIISLIENLSIEINNSQTTELVNQIEIQQQTITNIVTSLQLFVTNQIFNTINIINTTQNSIFNSITNANQNFSSLVQTNNSNDLVVNSVSDLRVDLKTIQSLIIDLDFNSTEINSINRSVNRILNNQSIHLALTRNIDNLILTEVNNNYNNIVFYFQQIINLINNIKEFDDNKIINFVQQIQVSQQTILSLVLELENYNDTSVFNLINELNIIVVNALNSIISIGTKLDNINQIQDNYKVWDCQLEETIDEPIDSLSSSLYTLNSQLYDIQNKICELDHDCGQLLPTDLAIWVNYGYYILFYWKWENPEIKTGLSFTQLPDPIEELISPSDIDIIWDQYFKDIYRIIGSQFSFLHTNNVKTPIYRGWFLDNNEAMRFYNSIVGLTQLPIREENNPAFPSYANKTTNIKNVGEKIFLRKVCIIEKLRYSDDIDHIITYAPSK